MDYFYINTNEKNAPGQYPIWLNKNLAFEHAYTHEGTDIDALSPGDMCLMYISGQGVKAVGEVLNYRDETPYQDHMIERRQRTDRNEYRIGVHWYLVRPEPITPKVLRNKFGLNSWQGTARRIIKNRHKAEDLIRYLEEECTRIPQEVGENEIAEPHLEGNLRQITVNAHERNQKARAKCISHYGCRCAVCGFNFEAKYGEVGKGVIEVHHITPLSQISGEYVVDPVEDLIPVCSNCHTIIHKQKPPYNIEEAKALLR